MSELQAEKFSFASYFAELLTTKEIRDTVDSVITEAIDQWGTESFSRKITSTPAKWVIKKSLSTPGNSPGKDTLSELLRKPENIEKTLLLLPVLIEGATDFLQAMTEHIQTLPEEKKLNILSGVFSSINPEKSGQILTGLARSLDSLYQSNPNLFSEKITANFETFLMNTDLSSVKDLFEHAQDDLTNTLSGISDKLFAYPAKLITVLSFLPGLSNIIISVLEDLTGKSNTLPPDILTDIQLSLFKEIDEKTIGRLINNINELVRQVHTGSALIGESGAPQFTTELLKKIRSVIHEIDPELLLKSGNALIDGKETVIKAFQTAIGENSEILMQHLKHFSSGRNANIRLLKHRLEVIENLSEEDAAEALAAGLSSWNAYDMAEVVNLVSIIANTIHEFSPGLLEKLIREFINTLDLDEFSIFLDWVVSEASGSLRPLVRTGAPIIIKGIMSSLTPENDGNNERIEEAREMVRQFIMGSEVTT